MPTRRVVSYASIVVVAPVIFAAVAVAAGYVLPPRIGAWPRWFYTYHPDRVITVVNAAAAAVTAGAAVFLLPLRPRFRAIIVVLASLVSLPVYILAWLGSFQVVQWFGLGWASTY